MLFYGLPVSLLLYSVSNIMAINDVLLERSSLFFFLLFFFNFVHNIILMKIWVQPFKAANTRCSNEEEQCAQLQIL